MATSGAKPARRSVGILGYGAVGQFLHRQILHDPAVAERLELAFVYNRSAAPLRDATSLPPHGRLSGADAAATVGRWIDAHGAPDIVAEVSHPDDVAACGPALLPHCDLFIASLTALADAELAQRLRRLATDNAGGHGLYLPAGAAWGVADVARLDAAGALRGLTVTMTFHADALRLRSPLRGALEEYESAA